MKRLLVLICIFALAYTIMACVAETVDERTLYLQIIESNDFERQLEVLPQLLEVTKFEEVFLLEQYGENELDPIYDNILLQYLIALMETDEDELLRNNVVEIFRNFRSRYAQSQAILLFLANNDYYDKLAIIVPEMLYAYNEMEEWRITARINLGSVLWQLLTRYQNHVIPEWLDIELDYLMEDLLTAFDFENQIREGYIIIDDVPERYVYEVNRLIETRQENGGFDMPISW